MRCDADGRLRVVATPFSRFFCLVRILSQTYSSLKGVGKHTALSNLMMVSNAPRACRRLSALCVACRASRASLFVLLYFLTCLHYRRITVFTASLIRRASTKPPDKYVWFRLFSCVHVFIFALMPSAHCLQNLSEVLRIKIGAFQSSTERAKKIKRKVDIGTFFFGTLKMTRASIRSCTFVIVL